MKGRYVVIALVFCALGGNGGLDGLANGVYAASGANASLSGGAQAGDPEGCTTQDKPVVVTYAASQYPNITDHIRDAVAAGKPKVLTLDRAGADENRDQSLAGIPTRPGQDRDEYPLAASAEGGKGADIRHIHSGENRSAGSAFGRAMRPYCSGQKFTFHVK